MFNFFFRRASRNRSSQTETPVPQPSVERITEPVSADLARTRLKSDALQNAAAFDRDEDAAVAFILQCGYADARLAAAQNIQSRAALEKVRRAMRDTDRRVAKLMQSRLDALERHRRNTEAASKCVVDAQKLAAHPVPTPNQVAQLDRSWGALEETPEPQQSDFQAARAVLKSRLEAQAALQRRVLDLGTQLKRMGDEFVDLPDAATLADATAAVDLLAADIGQCRSSAEAPSLPAAVMAGCEKNLQVVREKLEKAGARQAALSVRDVALSTWEAGELLSLDAGALRKEWKEADPANLLKTDTDAVARALQQRFEDLMQRIDTARREAVVVAKKAEIKVENAPPASEVTPNLQEVDAALAALDEALEQGALQAALVQDRLLRAMGAAAIRSDARRARLTSSRARLARLQDWARWGGGVSREELLKRAQQLPEREADPAILAQRVGDLRARWKTLDSSAGPASRESWEQFDAACNHAYEPAAAYFAAQAAAREANLARANNLIAEMREFASINGLAADALQSDLPAPDWKSVAQFCSRTIQQWQQIGPISRKEKAKAQEQFNAALRLLQEPLMHAQQAAAQRREALIAEATAVDPLQRDTLDILRSLQQRWQEEAKALPLTRNSEQLLWQRFRAACDSLIAQRRERYDAADASRQKNLQERQAVCAALEAAADRHDMPEPEIATLLGESEAAWAQLGEAPRNAQREIDERYQQAVVRLRTRIDKAQLVVTAAQWQTLGQRLILCRAVEQALLDGTGSNAAADDQQTQWQSLPPLPDALQHTLQRRFDAALSVSKLDGRQGREDEIESYRSILRANREALLQEILRLEILAGAETPNAYQRERLRLQVDVLQKALKSGRGEMTLGAQLQRVCGLPAATDDETGARIERVLATAQTIEPSALGTTKTRMR